MLKLTDLRKTTRRTSHDDLRTVYPRLLRDRALVPRVEMAVRYLEGMLGRPRRDLDADVLVRLFGDHKLARCLVACLASTYRHRARALAGVLPAEAVAGLAAQGVTTPTELRLWLFRRVNAILPGFVAATEREPFLAEAGAALGVDAGTIEGLLALDAPEEAILTRLGPVPTPEDVLARYNAAVAQALLANAPVLRLALRRAPEDADALRTLCAHAGVRAQLDARELALFGQQDAFQRWAWHGARLARLVTLLLACGLPARGGEALVAAPDGSQWRLRLDELALADLGLADAPLCQVATTLASWRRTDVLIAALARLRRQGAAPGWTVRRAVEPLIADGAVLPALLTCTRGAERVWVVPAPCDAAAAARMARLAARYPLVALAPAGAARVSDAVLMADVGGDTPGDATTAARALMALLDVALARAARESAHARLHALVQEATRVGLLAEDQLARRLGCAEEDLAAALAAPAAAAALHAHALRYVEGFGLCSAALLSRAAEASADVAQLRGNPAVGTAWLLRVLGRRLREVTGASEGIECLIAYLGAA